MNEPIPDGEPEATGPAIDITDSFLAFLADITATMKEQPK